MANKFFAWVEKAGEKALHVVEDIPQGAVVLLKLFADGQALAPEVKDGLTTLVKDGEALAVPFTAAVVGKGANWIEDAATVAAVEQLVKDFVAFLPTLETAGKKLIGDVTVVSAPAQS